MLKCFGNFSKRKKPKLCGCENERLSEKIKRHRRQSRRRLAALAILISIIFCAMLCASNCFSLILMLNAFTSQFLNDSHVSAKLVCKIVWSIFSFFFWLMIYISKWKRAMRTVWGCACVREREKNETRLSKCYTSWLNHLRVITKCSNYFQC